MEQIKLEEFLADYETGLIQDVFVVEKKIYGRITIRSTVAPPGTVFRVVWAELQESVCLVKKDEDGGCVTRSECSGIMTPLLKDVQTIRNALVGDDLRGGMVKELAEMRSEQKSVNGVNKEEKRTRELNLKLTEKRKWALIALVFTIVGYAVNYGLTRWG